MISKAIKDPDLSTDSKKSGALPHCGLNLVSPSKTKNKNILQLYFLSSLSPVLDHRPPSISTRTLAHLPLSPSSPLELESLTMSAVPSFQNPCIAPAFGSSEVWLVGVPTSTDGRLDAYIVDLTNIDTPNVRLITTRIETNKWRANAQKACFPYGNSVNDPSSPIVLQQFGSQTWSTNVYPNGTIVNGILFGTYTFTSPKLFSLSASIDGVDWFSVLMETRSNLTNSPWVGLRLNAVTDLPLRGRVE